MQHIKTQLEKYKDLSMAQFNWVKKNNITEFELIGDLADFDNDFVEYKNEKGETILVATNGEVYNATTDEAIITKQL